MRLFHIYFVGRCLDPKTPPEKAFAGSKHVLRRYFRRLGYINIYIYYIVYIYIVITVIFLANPFCSRSACPFRRISTFAVRRSGTARFRLKPRDHWIIVMRSNLGNRHLSWSQQQRIPPKKLTPTNQLLSSFLRKNQGIMAFLLIFCFGHKICLSSIVEYRGPVHMFQPCKPKYSMYGIFTYIYHQIQTKM